MNTKQLGGVIVVMGVLACSFPSRAALIAYEGCDYDVTNAIFGLSGGQGWAAPYSGGANAIFSVPDEGLTYADGTTNLAVRGRCFRGAYNSWDFIRRAVDLTGFGHITTNDDGGEAFGLEGTTNWFSLLTKFEGDVILSGGTYGVFVNRTFDTVARERLWIGARGANPFIANGLTNQWLAGGIGDVAQVYRAFPNAHITTGEVAFLVVRFIFGYPTPSNCHFSLWTNPSLAGTPPETSAVTNVIPMEVSGFSRLWDQVGLYAQINPFGSTNKLWYIDELRIGETFRDVAPRTFDISPVDAPVNIAPSNGAALLPQPITLQASAFNSIAPGDVHEATRVTLRSDNGELVTIVTGALTTFDVPLGLLKPATRYSWRVQYKGTNSPLYSLPSAETSFSTADEGQSTLLAYDGCAYDPTAYPANISGKTGGTGWLKAWEGVWTAGGTLFRVEADSPGLFYQFPGSGEYLLSTNNRFRTTERAYNANSGSEVVAAASRVTRQAGTDGGAHLLAPSGRYGKPGTTNWFSFIARYESGDTAGRFGVSLNIGLQNDTPYQFFMGKPTGATTWGIMALSNVAASSTKDALDGNTALLVTRVIHDYPEATVHMWINPQTRTAPVEAQADIATNVPAFEFNYIDVMSLGSQAPRTGIDEVRFGTDWQAVMPSGPAPPKYVGTPTNIAPADAAVNVSTTPVIQASAFNGAGPGDFHAASEFEFTSLESVSIVISTSGLTSFTMPAGLLQPSTRYAWRCRYLGTNNNVWSEWSTPTTFTTVRGTPRLIAYDGAGYGPTNYIGGFNGGFGWRGGWQAEIWNTLPPGTYYYTQIAVTNDGLEYGDLVTTNNMFLTTPFGWTYGNWGPTEQTPFSRARRLLSVDGNMHLLNANNTFGKPGTTNWLSFLSRFVEGTLGEYGVDFSLTNTGDNAGLAIGAVPDTGYLGAWVPGSSLQVATPVNVVGTTLFVVARLISGDPEDTLHLWVNPPLVATPPATPSATLTGIPHVEFDRLGLRAAYDAPTPFANLDELRFGETWESVTPIIPEPATVLALAGLALLATRRR